MKILSYIIAFGLGCAVTAFVILGSEKDPVKIVEKKEIVYQTIYRDYPSMSQPELAKELYKYDTGIPRLDGKMNGNIFHATAGLNKREWSRDFVLISSQSHNWRLYLTFAGAGAIAGGYMIYKIKK